ncbi:MAG: UMP kinase [Bacteroidetes bacterium CG02_land_8_20_14_3_00_31_25]|nr:UMP kinase [Bacteroidota bacterium]PIV58255.1 MAG: UMP kinase [Bacteroidetes bacterium CG02_land_8_20_14_3_00_31_25]PIX33687.1 MAG: UMP kinase [Bacteroidetes bacterium CG_4_8_14_3_um_filter_31_14]PIY03073.1 MAG: UMP kinase [Bacteroidetes bacterium CG_4_10_14_3_um_filter_31_20]
MVTYKRILLKLSGESLMGKSNYGIDANRLNEYAQQIIETSVLGVEIGIVIGGGNIFRGLQGVNKGFDRVKGDQMGMLATIINSIALQSAIESMGIKAKVLTSIRMEPVGEFYSKPKAIELMQQNVIVIIAGGTGNPFFTTDSASALRAIEIEANILLKGTRVDGVYSADPEKNPNATRFDEVTFDRAYKDNLHIMDLTAFTLCKENNMPILVFDMNKKGNLKRIISGEKIGTIVRN